MRISGIRVEIVAHLALRVLGELRAGHSAKELLGIQALAQGLGLCGLGMERLSTSGNQYRPFPFAGPTSDEH